tara:strand:- start:507 stop:767 length:261 start_codon:yes stop_codon:yes gene_type:complete
MGSSQSLIEATLEGNEEAMLELLEDPKTLEEKDEQGNTALHHACTSAQEGYARVIDFSARNALSPAVLPPSALFFYLNIFSTMLLL